MSPIAAPILPVSEIYGPVIQGEGAVIGTPTIFVRLGGCDYQCSWCDSLYAVLPKFKAEWAPMTAEEVIARIRELAPPPTLITLSGGNPALHRLSPLIEGGHELGYKFAIETQGSRIPSWLARLDHITLSPKPPSSGMTTNWTWLERWIELATQNNIARCLKVVVFDEADYEYARKIREMAWRWDFPMFVQAGTSDPYTDTSTVEGMERFRDNILKRTDWLGQLIIADGWYEVRVLPQLHALMYGAKRGV